MSSLAGESEQTSGRHIPAAERTALELAYGGKQCILTQRFDAVDWVHIIPHHTTLQAKRISNAKVLNLVPPEFNAVCRENILPLNKVDHTNFDDLTWTIYPTFATILRLIEHEESQLLRRHLMIQDNKPDPGRPPYEAFYGTLESSLPYDVHFGAEFIENIIVRNRDVQMYKIRSENGNAPDQFPTLLLICNVNVVLMMRTPAMAPPMLTLASEVFMAGAYLMTLWDSHPSQILRHFGLRPVFLPLPGTNPAQSPSIINLTPYANLLVPPPNASPFPGPSHTNLTPQSNMQLDFNDRSTYTLPMIPEKLCIDTTTTHNSHLVMSGVPTPPPSPSRAAAPYISIEVRQLVVSRWFRIVYPLLLGEEIIAPPSIPGKSKALTAIEAARLCGVKLARASTTDLLQGSACTLNAEQYPAPDKLGIETLEMIEAWRASACHTFWPDPNV